jgi:hypothetical protein
MYILIYVDDIINVSSSSLATNCLLEQLQVEFVVKDLGRLECFLNIEAHHTSTKLVLRQRRYIKDLLLRTNIKNSTEYKEVIKATTQLIWVHVLLHELGIA